MAVLGLSCSLQDTLVAACELLVVTCRVLVLLPGIKPMLPALGVQSLSRWTNREVSMCGFWCLWEGGDSWNRYPVDTQVQLHMAKRVHVIEQLGIPCLV